MNKKLSRENEMKQTLAIIKPNAVQNMNVGKIIDLIEEDFSIKEMKMKTLSKVEAEQFYAEHDGKPFFERLINFMISGPSVFLVLESNNDTIIKWREKLKGIRESYSGTRTEENAVHGSDSTESAKREISLIFG